MPGILDEGYGVADARREKLKKRIVIFGLLGVLVAAILYFNFRTWGEERTVKQFLATLERKDYQGGYQMWARKNYDPKRYIEDWGPDSQYSKQSASIANVDYCGDGVVISLTYPNAEPVVLIVDRQTKEISFSPWPRCPGRHWEFKRFFQSLFS
jgi:hypothetical protein